MALVPSQDAVIAQYSKNPAILDHEIGDVFYLRLFEIAQQTRAKVVVMEVADMDQAQRAVALFLGQGLHAKCEIWRDWPRHALSKQTELIIKGRSVNVGQGNGRAVVVNTGLDVQ